MYHFLYKENKKNLNINVPLLNAKIHHILVNKTHINITLFTKVLIAIVGAVLSMSLGYFRFYVRVIWGYFIDVAD